jgi:DNA-directed RNA polymerase subunit H
MTLIGEKETLEEKRAALLIKYRSLHIDKIEKEDDRIVYHLSSNDKKLIMLCLLNRKTIGIAFVRELKAMIESEGAAKGIIVGNGKYTYSAKNTSRKIGMELVSPLVPIFDIFEHEYVPRHEILNEAERRDVLKRFHAKPHQFPWIKASDPLPIILGAEPGDILRITGESSTAGMSKSFRYVVK